MISLPVEDCHTAAALALCVVLSGGDTIAWSIDFAELACSRVEMRGDCHYRGHLIT